jgi:hypothetical protein
MIAASPFLTAAEAADFLGFTKTAPTNPVKAFHNWRYRHAGRVKTYRRGGTVLFKQCDLEAALTVTGRSSLRRAV